LIHGHRPFRGVDVENPETGKRVSENVPVRWVDPPHSRYCAKVGWSAC